MCICSWTIVSIRSKLDSNSVIPVRKIGSTSINFGVSNQPLKPQNWLGLISYIMCICFYACWLALLKRVGQ